MNSNVFEVLDSSFPLFTVSIFFSKTAITISPEHLTASSSGRVRSSAHLPLGVQGTTTVEWEQLHEGADPTLVVLLRRIKRPP